MDSYQIEIGGTMRQYAILDSAVAIAPEEKLKKKKMSKAKTANYFGKLAEDDRKGVPGTVLPFVQRRAFEKAGWIFAEPTDSVRKSAQLRAKSERADIVREVCFDDSGDPIICTDFVIIKFKAGYSPKRALSHLKKGKFTRVQKLNFGSNLYRVKIPARKHALQFVQELQQSENIYEIVEPVFLENLGLRFRPNDESNYKDQWHWFNNGSNGDVAGRDVDAEEAWDVAKGDGVRLAIVDLGFHVNSPELKSGIIGGGSFEVSMDGSETFTRFVSGSSLPKHFHGTFCAAMAGARINSGKGCGIAPNCSLILVTVNEITTQLALAKAINYAVSGTLGSASTAPHHAGAQVLSCSLGKPKTFAMTDHLKDAIDFAVNEGRPAAGENLGTPVFWAAANFNVPIADDLVCSYKNTISVGCSDSKDERGNSAVGSGLDFLAPGVQVQNISGNGTFGPRTGTSYATPVAAGIAALMIEANPGLHWEQIRDEIRATCDKVDLANAGYDNNGHSQTYGYGRVNAGSAVDRVRIV